MNHSFRGQSIKFYMNMTEKIQNENAKKHFTWTSGMRWVCVIWCMEYGIGLVGMEYLYSGTSLLKHSDYRILLIYLCTRVLELCTRITCIRQGLEKYSHTTSNLGHPENRVFAGC